MYTLLIVDDEEEIVEGLYELFSEDNKLELDIYKAYSAEEALGYFENIKIDVIISDIRMPGTTGLQLMDKIKVNWPKCQFILLTGYSNFDYVYKAIQNNGVRYLVKTESDIKIIETVKEAILDLEGNLKREEIIVKAKQQLALAIPVMQKDFLNQLLEWGNQDLEILEEKFQELKIKLKANFPTLIIVGRFDDFNINKSFEKRYEEYYVVKQIADECISNGINKILIENKGYFMVWILQPFSKEESNYAEIFNAAKSLSNYIRGSIELIQYSCRNNLNMTMSFAVTYEPFYLDLICEKFDKLKKLLTYSINMSKEAIIFDNCFSSDTIEDEKKYTNSRKIQNQLNKVKIIDSFFELRQRDEYFKLFDEITSNSWEGKNNFNVQIYYNIAIIIINFMNQYKLTKQIEERIDLSKLVHVSQRNIDENSISYLRAVSEMIFQAMDSNELIPLNIVMKVKNYIDTHLKADLSLTRLAELVHFNPSYLSRLFKQEVGYNITEYVLNIRIEKAKELLKINTMKINEISVEVGYESSHSFARVFKNELGISPQDYRLSIRSKRL